jgi:hypothetical protein
MSKRHVARLKRNLPTSQARTALPSLVREMVAVSDPGKTLADHAVEVGPRNRGGVWLLPAVDVEAAIEREERLQRRIEALEDEAENMAIGLFLTRRLEDSSGESVSGAQFIRELGFEEIAADLPA